MEKAPAWGLIFEMNIKEELDTLLDSLEDRKQKLTRLEELKAPDVIIEYERELFNELILEVSKYFDMKNIESVLKRRKIERQKEYREWRKQVGEELKKGSS